VSEEGRSGDGDRTRAWREAAMYLGLGTGLAACILVGIWAGSALDRRLGTEPTFFWVGAAFGLAAAGWQFFRQVTKKP
jgi:F0F1-type ATP synthase assembly protein I